MTLNRNDSVQLRLAACFQTEIEFAAVRDDFFHYRLHLIHLNGIDNEVFAFVIVFLCGFLKAACSLLDTAVENVGKAQKHRRSYISECQLIHNIAQINLCIILTRRDIDISLIVNAEVRSSPTVDVIQFFGVFNGPFLHFKSLYFK